MENTIDYFVISQVVAKMVIDLGNSELVLVPTNFEVRTTTFALDPSSAIGPDGFPRSFYHATWDNIEWDVFKLFNIFFYHKFFIACNLVVRISKA